jgi:hypothetical protein
MDSITQGYTPMVGAFQQPGKLPASQFESYVRK